MSTSQSHSPAPAPAPAPAVSAPPVSRRSLLAAMGAMGIGSMGLSACATATRTDGSTPRSGRLFRIAHLTDSHVQPERTAEEGLNQCLAHVHALSDRPDLIVTGGDLIMDSFETTKARAEEQWKLFNGAFAAHKSIPVMHCLGNHDIWGWDKPKSGTNGSEPGWGKRYATDMLGVPGWYYAQTHRGVKVITLDSVQPDVGNGYVGGLDDQQFEWLKGELGATPRTQTVVIVTHIPVIHVSTLLVDATFSRLEGARLGAGTMLMDARRVHNLLERHPNVRLVLTGHIHMTERVEYAGITHINSGAVSGAWWRSQDNERRARAADTADGFAKPAPRSDPGYGLIDLHANGALDFKYQSYGRVNSAI